MSLVDALELCGLSGDSWTAWRAAAKALSASPMTPAERTIYEACTGRTTLPREPIPEALFLVGRRGGKSRFAGAIGVHRAAMRYPQLAPGERAIVGVAASDRDQARVLLGYVSSPFRQASTLRPLVQQRSRWNALRALVSRETRWGLDLVTDVSIEVTTASFRRARGRTFAAAICDEISFWDDGEGVANPAAEVLNAIRPALATLQGPLVLISTPFARRGVTFYLFTKYYGVNGAPVLVWRAPSTTMNPLFDPRIVEDALERDEAAAKAEYLAEFRTDLESFITVEALKRVTVAGRTELEPLPCDQVEYAAFVDPSGGSGSDSFTVGVAHGEVDDGGRVVAVLDCLREVKPPFSPEDVVRQFCAVLSTYHVTRVTGDAYAGEWPRQAFARHGIAYRVSERTRSELYRELLPAIHSQRVELLDAPRLLGQLGALERRVGPSGRDAVDHPSRGHDDVSNAAAGSLTLVLDAAARPEPSIGVL